MNINLIPFPEITTNRLLLRALTMDDRDELLLLRSDDRVNKYLDRPKTISMDEAEAYVKKIEGLLKNNACVYWVIALKDSNVMIGTICLWNFFPENDMVEIGYELNPAYHGQGMMQEAIEKVIEYGFDVMQLKIITAITNPNNERSIRRLQENHFQQDLNFKYVSKEDANGRLPYFLKNSENLRIYVYLY